jgi:Arc/MetJ family transcription regulator
MRAQRCHSKHRHRHSSKCAAHNVCNGSLDDRAELRVTLERNLDTRKEAHMAPKSSLARKNFIVDDVAVRALKQALRVPTESEAVRIAVRDRLAIEEAQAAFGRISRRGGLDDLFQRSAPDRRGGKNGRAPGSGSSGPRAVVRAARG